MSEKQLQFDEPRYKRQMWLERVRIPRFKRTDGSLARTATLKSLLRVLESHIRSKEDCCLKIVTVAAGMGVSERTASRAIADAELCGLIAVERCLSKHGSTRYRIEWRAVAELILAHPETASLIEIATKVPTDVVNSPTDETPSERGSTGRESAHFQEVKPTKPGKKTGSATDPVGLGGWPFVINRNHFRSMPTLQSLWEHAINQNWGLIADHAHRLKFFTLAKWIARSADEGRIPNPGGALTSQLKDSIKSGIWLGSDSDEAAARIALNKFDREQRVAG